jgi:hypothetical protein
MTVVLAKPSEKQVKTEIRAMKSAAKEISVSTKTAREFLRRHGFITKDNSLHQRYR